MTDGSDMIIRMTPRCRYITMYIQGDLQVVRDDWRISVLCFAKNFSPQREFSKSDETKLGICIHRRVKLSTRCEISANIAAGDFSHRLSVIPRDFHEVRLKFNGDCNTRSHPFAFSAYSRPSARPCRCLFRPHTVRKRFLRGLMTRLRNKTRGLTR